MTRNILRIGLYQIIYMQKVPQSAAVDESVKLAKKYTNSGSVKFINAILRSFIRNPEIISTIYTLSDLQRLSVKYSVNEWIVSLLMESYPDKYKEILNNLNEIAITSLRVNTEKISSEDLLVKLKKYDDTAYLSPTLQNCIHTEKASLILNSDEFKNGLFYIQDYSAQLAVNLLNPKKDETVIDVCASPGGKSFLSSLLMKNSGKIISMELYESRLSLIEKGMKKLGLTNITPICHDSQITLKQYQSKADKVICDVPCSGLGVIKKKPDIRYKNKKEIDSLIEIQKNILDSSCKYLKIGGLLLYSTCTLNPDENENITNDFLKKNNNFKRLISDNVKFPLTVLPNSTRDGFFIDILVKEK